MKLEKITDAVYGLMYTAYKYDDKPNQMYLAIAKLADVLHMEDTDRAEIRRLMENKAGVPNTGSVRMTKKLAIEYLASGQQVTLNSDGFDVPLTGKIQDCYENTFYFNGMHFAYDEDITVQNVEDICCGGCDSQSCDDSEEEDKQEEPPTGYMEIDVRDVKIGDEVFVQSSYSKWSMQGRVVSKDTDKDSIRVYGLDYKKATQDEYTALMSDTIYLKGL